MFMRSIIVVFGAKCAHSGSANRSVILVAESRTAVIAVVVLVGDGRLLASSFVPTETLDYRMPHDPTSAIKLPSRRDRRSADVSGGRAHARP